MPGNQNYFLNFPSIKYNGFTATNILARSVIAERFINNSELFYEYTVKDGETINKIAFDSYGNSAYVWVISLFNKITDPYYDWPLSQIEFDNMINSKYDGYSNAQIQIQYYQNNWASDSSFLDLSGYAALPDYAKKYWSPLIAPGNIVYKYQRTQADTIVTTNQINQIPISISGNTYSTGEIVTQDSSTGFVAYANTSMLTLQHIVGAFNNTDIITGGTSNVSTNPAGSVLQTFVIPNDESVYFSSVSALDVETENNAAKAQIKILKNDYLNTIQNAFGSAMSS